MSPLVSSLRRSQVKVTWSMRKEAPGSPDLVAAGKLKNVALIVCRRKLITHLNAITRDHRTARIGLARMRLKRRPEPGGKTGVA